jgi:hypothetical protein
MSKSDGFPILITLASALALALAVYGLMPLDLDIPGKYARAPSSMVLALERLPGNDNAIPDR